MTLSLRMLAATAAAVMSLTGLNGRVAAQVSTACPTLSASPLPVARQGVPYGARLYGGPGSMRLVSEPGVEYGLYVQDSSRWKREGAVFVGTPLVPGTMVAELKVSTTTPCPGFAQIGPTTWEIQKEWKVDIRDTQPPTLESVSLGPATLPASGGTVSVLLWAVDNFAVARALLTTTHPDGHSGSAYLKQTFGVVATAKTIGKVPPGVERSRWELSFTLPANTSTSPAVYRFALTVSDRDLNAVKPEPVTVTVAAHAPPPLRPPAR